MSDAMRCETCRHWTLEREVANGNYVSDLHEISRLPDNEGRYLGVNDENEYLGAPTDIRVCRAVLFYERPGAGQAAVVDGSDYHGILITHATFGCTLHSAVAVASPLPGDHPAAHAEGASP